jgi:hypothetical protein
LISTAGHLQAEALAGRKRLAFGRARCPKRIQRSEEARSLIGIEAQEMSAGNRIVSDTAI